MTDGAVILPAYADWPVEPLEQLTRMVRRGTAPVYVESSDVFAIGQRCVTQTDFDPNASRPHSARAMSRVLAPLPGDVLVNSTGTGTIGRSVVFEDASRQFIVDGHVTIVRPRGDRALGYWLNEVLRSPWGQTYLESFCYSGSTNQVELSASALIAARLSVPSVPEQRRMAEILGTLDEQIAKTRQIIAKLKLLKQGLLDDLLTYGIDEQGKLRDPARYPEGFADTELGRLPTKWAVSTIKSLLADVDPAMRSGPFGSALLKHELVSAGVPLLGIDNVHVEHFRAHFTRFVTEQKAAELSRYRVRAGDVMITIMGTVGRSCVVPEDVPHALSSKHVWTMTFDERRYLPHLISAQLNHSPRVRAQLRRDEQGGIMSAIRSDTLRQLMLPAPPIEEQHQIVAVLRSQDRRISSEEAELDKLRLLKEGLASDLMTGRVRVAAEAAA